MVSHDKIVCKIFFNLEVNIFLSMSKRNEKGKGLPRIMNSSSSRTQKHTLSKYEYQFKMLKYL